MAVRVVVEYPPKSSFRYLKQSIQIFRGKYVLVPADKAANNVVVVCRFHYNNTLQQELNSTNAYTVGKTVVNSHLNEMPLQFSVGVNTFYDLLVTRPDKSRFIANSSSCTTTKLSELLTSCLTAVKSRGIRYYQTVYEMSRKNMFWSIEISGKVLSKLTSRGFCATSLPTYDFSTLYTILPNNLIKGERLDLSERVFKRPFKIKVRFISHVTIGKRFLLLQTIGGINFCIVRMYVTLIVSLG